MRVLLIAVLSMYFVGCATKSLGTSATSELDYLRADGPATDAEKIRVNLTRSTNLNLSTTLRARVLTVPLAKSEASKNLEEQAFREKWEDSKLQKALAERYKKIESENRDKTCFLINVESYDPSVGDSKAWHGHVVDSAKSQHPVTFSRFVGSVLTTRTTEIRGTRSNPYATTRESARYFHVASACTSTPVDITKPFHLTLEPRYDRDISPVTLSWIDEATEKQAIAEVNASDRYGRDSSSELEKRRKKRFSQP